MTREEAQLLMVTMWKKMSGITSCVIHLLTNSIDQPCDEGQGLVGRIIEAISIIASVEGRYRLKT